MNKFTLFIFSFSTLSLAINAQSNCNNHVQVTICPTTAILQETNLGMGDDAPAAINIPGEDVFYEIFAPNGAQKIFISISNATGPIIISLGQTACNSGPFNTFIVPPGSSNTVFPVTISSTYFLWLDGSTTINYDISFGADTGMVYVNIPNIQGNLQFDSSSCNTPVFRSSKPFFQVSYNNVFKTDPMTLAPLGVQGTMCISTFIKNTTGIEGVKKFQFEFDTLGYSSFNTSNSVPGMFVSGNWYSDKVANKIILTFVDALGNGRGDFSGTPNSCLNYNFCFDIMPVSNDPLKTNVKVTIQTDGFGQGYSGIMHVGCCPSPIPNCLGPGANGSGSGPGNSMGYAFADPGSPLPIELIDFTAKAENDLVIIKWMTASEVNNEYFSVERSKDGNNWEKVRNVEGAGNSSSLLSYEIIDNHPLKELSYYRLKQTDFDGNFSYSTIVNVYLKKSGRVKVYPNPAHEQLTIEANEISTIRISLFDIMNKIVPIYKIDQPGRCILNTSQLPAGIYYLIVERNNLILTREKIIVQK